MNVIGTCKCGCGQPTSVATRNRKSKGQCKDHHVNYVKGHNPGKTFRQPGADTKYCPKCKLEKPITDFHSHTKRLQSYCKSCLRQQQRDWRAENPEKYALIMRRCRVKKKYKISWEEYLKILAAQNNACAVCGGDNSGKVLCLDHCHVSGKARGLLCRNCNLALGFAKESVDILEKMVAYLKIYNFQLHNTRCCV